MTETQETQQDKEAWDVNAGPVPFRLRPYRGESGFVAGTWLRSYESSPAVRRVDSDEYYKQHARLVSRIIDRSHVLIAEHMTVKAPDGEPLLLGHAVGERDRQGCVIHYVYVKGGFRRAGIGSALWDSLLEGLTVRGGLGQVRYTHARNPWSEIAARRGWSYSPYPAFRHGLEE